MSNDTVKAIRPDSGQDPCGTGTTRIDRAGRRAPALAVPPALLTPDAGTLTLAQYRAWTAEEATP